MTGCLWIAVRSDLCVALGLNIVGACGIDLCMYCLKSPLDSGVDKHILVLRSTCYFSSRLLDNWASMLIAIPAEKQERRNVALRVSVLRKDEDKIATLKHFADLGGSHWTPL